VHHHRGIVHHHINAPLVGEDAIDRRTAACVFSDIELQRAQVQPPFGRDRAQARPAFPLKVTRIEA
jgi:hypothetical protein